MLKLFQMKFDEGLEEIHIFIQDYEEVNWLVLFGR